VPVETAEEMSKALTVRLSWSTVVIMSAAVADFRPKHPAAQKLKKHQLKNPVLDLEPTGDILAELSARRTGQLLVGFAAETGDLLRHAKQKLEAKGVDLIVANDVTTPGAGFGSDRNAATLIDRDGTISELGLRSKRRLADDILDASLRLLRAGARQSVTGRD
ncbi:MAG TPA: phosphopantothenoylcysteine decarboxylase, partial [Nitrospira sp.]|nr:phosphopantothenoylcysteine decarboxylase [Nitrospira sp.]